MEKMDFNNLPDEFYPTPPELIAKMLAPVIRQSCETILEPSAGKGDILDFIALYKKNEGVGYRWYMKRFEKSNFEQKATEAIKGCYWKKKVVGVPICGGTCVPCSETIRAGQCETLIELFNKEQEGGETDDG